MIRNILAACAIASLSLGSVALAKGAAKGGEPNCEVKGKKIHVKDKAACDKKKGTFTETAAAAPAAAAPAEAAPAEAAPAEKAP